MQQDLVVKVAPRVGFDPVEGHDPVADLNPGLIGGRVRLDVCDDRRLGFELRNRERDHARDERDHQRRDDVHGRPGDGHQKAMPLRVGQKLVRSSLALLGDIVARHLHVSAQRKKTYAVVRIAALEAKEALAKPEAEDLNADPEPLGHQEMPKLVDKDHRTENQQEPLHRVGQIRQAPTSSPRNPQRAGSVAHSIKTWPADRWNGRTASRRLL